MVQPSCCVDCRAHLLRNGFRCRYTAYIGPTWTMLYLAQLAHFAVESASRFVAAGESDQGVGWGMGRDIGV
jgi:hypothetical protein